MSENERMTPEQIERKYQDAVRKASLDNLILTREALDLFRQIADQKDVSKEIAECEAKINAAEKESAARETKKKRSAGLIAAVLVIVIAAGAGFFIMNKNKASSSIKGQLLNYNWYQLYKGIPDGKLTFTDNTATFYDSFDYGQNNWTVNKENEWKLENISNEGADLSIGEDHLYTVNLDDKGAITALTTSYGVSYYPVPPAGFSGEVSASAADTRTQLYEAVLKNIHRADGKYSVDLPPLLEALGDYEDCAAISEELAAYIDLNRSANGEYAGTDGFAALLDYANNAKFITVSDNLNEFLKKAYPFIGNWKFSSGDVKAISYSSTDESGFYEIKTIEITGVFDFNADEGTLHITYNGGTAGRFLNQNEIDAATMSFEQDMYRGGSHVYSLKNGNTFHVDFKAKSGSPAPKTASADYKLAD